MLLLSLSVRQIRTYSSVSSLLLLLSPSWWCLAWHCFVYSTAELISRFMADLWPNRQAEKMAAALSLLPTQGLVKGGIKHTTHA